MTTLTQEQHRELQKVSDVVANIVEGICNDHLDALFEIEQLRKQIQKMRTALKPFANIAGWQDDNYRKLNDDQEITIEAIDRDCTLIFRTTRQMQDFRLALKMLQESSNEENNKKDNTRCVICEQNPADYPKKICVGCEAYKEHQS